MLSLLFPDHNESDNMVQVTYYRLYQLARKTVSLLISIQIYLIQYIKKIYFLLQKVP